MLEPKARIKSGLIAVALGLTTTFSTVGGPFSLLGNTAGNSATAQEIRQHAVAPATGHQQPVAAPVQDAYLLSAQKLHASRKAVATRDIATAERLAMEVRAMNLNYRETDDRPEHVLRLIHEYKNVAEIGRSAPNSEQFRRSFAVFSMNQAETMLQRGELDLALQLTQEAANQNVPYNHSERQAGLEPTAMFKRIEDARRVQSMNTPTTTSVQMQQPLSQAAQQHMNQSISILRQARDAMNAGQLDRAEQLCQVASKYKLAESVYPVGSDTPNRLLAEIAAKRQSAPSTMVAMQPMTPVATPAVYNAPQNPMQPIQQVRDNGPAAHPQQVSPMVATNAPIVDQVMRDRQTVVNQFSSEIMQQISDARKMSQEHRNPDAGLEILQNAKRRIEESQLDADTKRMFIVHIDRAIQDTVRFVEKYEAQFALDRQNQAVWDERRREAEQFRSKEERLKTLFDECNKLINEQRFEEAVIVAKKAREFAPDDSATHMLLTTTNLAANTYRSIRIKEEKDDGFIAWMHSVDEASIPTDLTKNPMIYGENWKELTQRRRSSDEVLRMRRPESERMIFRRLEDPVSINLDRPMPLDQVLRILSGQTGVDIFVDWGALHEVDVTSERMVTVNIMREIRFKSVLSMILEPLGLSYVVKHEMLHITSATKAKGEMVIKSHYVGDLIMGIPNFNGQNPNDFNNALSRAINTQAGAGFVKGGGPMLAGHTQVDPNLMAAANPGMLAQNFGSGSGTGGLASSGFGQGGGYTGPPMAGNAAGGTADFTELMDLIEAVVSPDSWDEGGEMMEYYPNLSLVVRQTEEVHAEIVDLLAQLRKLNDLQIAVEVRYITLADDFYEKMGIDFDINFRNDGAQSRVTTQLNSSGDNDDNSGTELTVSKGNSVTVGLSAPGEISADLSIPIAQNSYGLSDPSYGGFQVDGGLTMGFALLNEIEAYFFLNATQGDTRSNILQAPKVTIFNGQMGSVTDVSMQPFVTSVIPYVGDFAAAYQPVIVILNEGQYMTVQGVVSNNRQYVRLTLNPVFSKITKIDTFRYVGEDTSTDETETSAKGNDKEPTSGDERNSTKRSTRSNSGVTIQLPTLATFSVSTTVSVPDGGTILLGGIKRLSEGRKENGVPMLNKIPYINRLFMNTAIGRSTQSIMMMVTPRIIIQEEEEEYLTGIRPQP